MRTFLISTCILVLSLGLYTAHTTPQATIDTSVSINAAPEKVFATIADYGNWEKWTAIYREISVQDPAADGKANGQSTVLFTTNSEGMPSVGNTAWMQVFEGPGDVLGDAKGYKYKISWRGSPFPKTIAGYVMQGHHWWVIRDDGKGGTVMEHGEQLEGVAKWLTGQGVRDDIKKMLVRFNGNLKRWLEEGKGLE